MVATTTNKRKHTTVANSNIGVAKPLKMSASGEIPKVFVDVYSFLISAGHMDKESFACTYITNDGSNFKFITSRHLDDHNKNLIDGMAYVKENEDGEYFYYLSYMDANTKFYTQQSMVLKFPDTHCVFKFKAKYKLPRPKFTFNSKTRLVESTKDSEKLVKMDNRIVLRSFAKIKDSKPFYFARYGDDYGVICFSKDWSADVIIKILKDNWNIHSLNY